MAITLQAEPVEPVVGDIVKIQAAIEPPESKRVKITAKDITFDPEVIQLDAEGKGSTTCKAPERQTVTISAVELDAAGNPSGDPVKYPLKIKPVTPSTLESLKQTLKQAQEASETKNQEFQQAQAEADKKKNEAAQLQTNYQQIKKMVDQVEKLSGNYTKVSAAAKDAKKELKEFVDKRLENFPLTEADKAQIDKWRKDKQDEIKQLEDTLAALDSRVAPPHSESNQSIQDAQSLFALAKEEQDKARVAADRVATGLEKELTEYLKSLVGFKKQLEEARKSGDLRVEYFLLRELQDELGNLQEPSSVDGPLDNKYVYALDAPLFEAQFSLTTQKLKEATEILDSATEEQKKRQKDRDVTFAKLGEQKKTRKQAIMKSIKEAVIS